MMFLFFLSATTIPQEQSPTGPEVPNLEVPCHKLSPYEAFGDGGKYRICVKKSIISLVLPHFDLLIEVIKKNDEDREWGIKHVTYVLHQILNPWHVFNEWAPFSEALRDKIQIVEDLVKIQPDEKQRQREMKIVQPLLKLNNNPL